MTTTTTTELLRQVSLLSDTNKRRVSALIGALVADSAGTH